MPFCAPQIVYSNSFTGSSALSETILTPSVAGVFRITLAWSSSAFGSESVWQVDINGTYQATSTAFDFEIGFNTEDAQNGTQQDLAYLEGGQPISLTSTLDAGSASTYTLIVVVEQLA